MDSLINRQVAIDEWRNDFKGYVNTLNISRDDYNGIMAYIDELPSAQPENIKCYECKHGIHSGCGDVYICHVSPELVMEHAGDFYCGYAKRETDEEAN